MASFQLTSDITIGKFRFSGVHEVRIQRAISSYTDRATIVIPAICTTKNGKLQPDGSIQLVPGTEQTSTTGTLFDNGDEVSINLGYNGQLQNEFMGFVKRKGTGYPLEVECEGYSYQLRNRTIENITDNFRKTPTTLKKLLQLAVNGTDITLQCDADINLIGIKLVKYNGLHICDVVKQISDNSLTLFFMSPKVLWCGLPMTAYATGAAAANLWGFPVVSYRLGYNCIRDNALQERIPEEPVQVIFKGKYADGTLLHNKSKETDANNKHIRITSQIADNASMGQIAQEKAYHLNYKGYEGKISGFLQPFVQPGYDAHIQNKDRSDLDGNYLIEATDVTFGINGAKRELSIGPRVGFDN